MRLYLCWAVSRGWGGMALPSRAVVTLAPQHLEGSSSDSAVQTHGEVSGRVKMQKKPNNQAKNIADVVSCSACA